MPKSPRRIGGSTGKICRAMLDSLLLYLPLALMGWKPSTPSYLRFLPNDVYFAAQCDSAQCSASQWLALRAMRVSVREALAYE